MRSKGKFGLRSGNSFRFGSRLSGTGLRHSCDQHVIIKTIVDDSATDTDWRRFVGRRQAEQLLTAGSGDDHPCRAALALAARLIPDGGLPFDDNWRIPGEPGRLNAGGPMSLTLNKRRRWLLPAMIDDAIDRLRQDDIQLSDDVDAAGASLARITHSTRVIVPRLSGGPFRGSSALAADCVAYGDSAGTAKRRVTARRHKTSFYADLRRAAAADTKPPSEQPSTRCGRLTQTHTRGVQRLSNVKRRRSRPNERFALVLIS